MNNKKRTYIYGHTSPETAKVVQNYPWGFRLKTSKRYWIETSHRSDGGQRFCSQTVDPRTGNWCAPKKSTYCAIAVMFLDENDHVRYTILDQRNEQDILKFKDIHLENLDEFQKEQVKKLLATEKVLKGISFTYELQSTHVIGPVSLFSKRPEEIEKMKQISIQQEQIKQREEERMRQINIAIAHEMNKVEL